MNCNPHLNTFVTRGSDTVTQIPKPKIGISEKDLNVEIFNSQPGEAIVFNDQLLHGGVVGQSKTRVSLEFTIFVKNENYYN